MGRKKWHTGELPEGFPTQCNSEELSNVLQDLTGEYYQKKQSGKNNKIWEDLILQLIKSARDEMFSRLKQGPITITYAGGEGGKGGYAGGGGGGGGGPGGGRGGDGGSVIVMNTNGDHSDTKSKKPWFSMDNPLVYIFVYVVVVIVLAYLSGKFGLPSIH